ncbi:LCP family protein [Streptomyces sp. TR06-5]|uniref:LCP family protein n=1 Tax=unclassified Streptomyces TaxID=2593676 RepID=UPI0039A0810C
MNQWPDSYDRGSDRYGRGSAAPTPEGARAMPHVRQRPSVPPQDRGGYADAYAGHPDSGYDSGWNEGQVYGGRGGGHGGPGGYDPYGAAPGRPRPSAGRRFKRICVTVLVVALVWVTGTYFWADSELRREVDLGIVQERPESAEGTTYLIVGSDSRDGMSDAEMKDLHTGGPSDGGRTDTMMILHVGPEGDTLVSLPRDSWVTIPSFTGSESGKEYPARGGSKLNASYAYDGPTLLVRTVEYNTGLKIDHYAEIGFGGFAKIVDAVGGVEMDIPRDIKDKNSGSDFRKGKQTLDGKQALAFVRNRYEAGSDLERTKNQQKFLSALADQTATPSTLLNPFKLYPTMGAGLETLKVDKDMSLFDLMEMFWAMKGISGGESGGRSMNMPLTNTPAPGGSLQWDMARVEQLVGQIQAGEKVTVPGGRP